jgi:urease accessory protein
VLADLRLFQLVSPTLPIGGFTYSQGLEWAVEAKWIRNDRELEQWLQAMLEFSVSSLEVPVLLRLQRAFNAGEADIARRWCRFLIASRETEELRREERQRGAALARLLPGLDIATPAGMEDIVAASQLCGIALAADRWHIDPIKSCAGYCWNWMENAVTAGVKLVPLGQTQGQQLLFRLSEQVPAAIARAMALGDDDIGSCTPALAIASSCHETQYTRLFRS